MDLITNETEQMLQTQRLAGSQRRGIHTLNKDRVTIIKQAQPQDNWYLLYEHTVPSHAERTVQGWSHFWHGEAGTRLPLV